MCFVLLTTFLTMRTVEHFARMDTITSMTKIAKDTSVSFDLFENGYRFAVSKLDERAGQIKVQHVT